MSHSTHVGFSCPPICSDNGRELRCIVAELALPLRQSRADGVGNIVTAPDKYGLPLPSLRFGPPFSPSHACGVGHIFTATWRLVIVFLGPPFIRCFIAM